MSAKNRLVPYRAKRRFDETTEPRGDALTQEGARYLIQKHDATRLHYDLRLELDGVLLSWAVTRGPSYDPQDKRLAVRTEDHPLDYGDFEGTIPKGQYGGGTVMLWDSGQWEPIGDPKKGLKAGKLAFILHGQKLRGKWALVRMRQKEKEKRESWLLIKEHDDLAGVQPELLTREAHSVKSGRSMREIATDAPPRKKPATPALPRFEHPALATLVDTPPIGGNWLFEIKYDGYRAIIAADGPQVIIFTRSGLDWTSRYPAIAGAVAALNLPATLLDGEICVVRQNGGTDFGALVAALKGHKSVPLTCFLFDLLKHKGKDIRSQPLSGRRRLLEKLLAQQAQDAPLQLSATFTGDGAELLTTACARGLEGLVAKRADTPYRAGRHQDWLKLKCQQGQELVIIGFAVSDKPGRPFASLLMATQVGEGLRYAGRIGTGFTGEILNELAAWRNKHRRKTPACDVPAALRRETIWVKPNLVAEVSFANWTADGLIRHGRFIALRGDKPSIEVRREMPRPALQITHPDKLIYPAAGLTKRDLALYVRRATPLLWPYVKSRFVSLVRCPDGIAETCFFQRHLGGGFGDDWAEQDYETAKGKHEHYLYPVARQALLEAVQMGVTEFHIWGAKRDKPDIPDRLVFDLDPDAGLAFDAVKSAAVRLRDVLAALGLASMPMLSGGKGLHVVVPLRRRHDFETIKKFCRDVARQLEDDQPQRFTATMSKAKRKGKIFVDYFRNEAGATAIAPFSPRARESAAVAWPCNWEQLDRFSSASAVTIPQAMQTLEDFHNPWDKLTTQTLSSVALQAAAEK